MSMSLRECVEVYTDLSEKEWGQLRDKFIKKSPGKIPARGGGAGLS